MHGIHPEKKDILAENDEECGVKDTTNIPSLLFAELLFTRSSQMSRLLL